MKHFLSLLAAGVLFAGFASSAQAQFAFNTLQLGVPPNAITLQGPSSGGGGSFMFPAPTPGAMILTSTGGQVIDGLLTLGNNGAVGTAAGELIIDDGVNPGGTSGNLTWSAGQFHLAGGITTPGAIDATGFVAPLYQGADAAGGTATTVRAGNNTTAAGTGGALTVAGGVGGSGNSAGGTLTVIGGAGTGTGIGGVVSIVGGPGALSDTGNVNIYGGGINFYPSTNPGQPNNNVNIQQGNLSIQKGNIGVAAGSVTVGGMTGASLAHSGLITGTALTLTTAPFTTAGVVHNNASGVFSSSAVNLAGASTEITGVLAIANGGTGAATVGTGNEVFASPDGASGPPSFRLLASGDIPSGSGSYIQNTTGPVQTASFDISGSAAVAGNSTIGTGASTVNTFGNGGATSNTIGSGATTNEIGLNAATNDIGRLTASTAVNNFIGTQEGGATVTNYIGQSGTNSNQSPSGAATNWIGGIAYASGSTVTNNIGEMTGTGNAAANITNTIGINAGASGSGSITTTIGTTAASFNTSNTTIGGGAGTSSVTIASGTAAGTIGVTGTTNINTSGSAATTIGSTSAGATSIAGSSTTITGPFTVAPTAANYTEGISIKPSTNDNYSEVFYQSQAGTATTSVWYTGHEPSHNTYGDYIIGFQGLTGMVGTSAGDRILEIDPLNGSAVFGGALTVSGTLTGTLSGNATTANSVNNSLSDGTHITGGSFNGSAAITIGTDATNLNTASTIVARDGSGNFSAGTITAALSGNATTANSVNNSLSDGTHITGGSFNGSAAITIGTDATNLNTASTIVARDGSGNFSAGTITAALTGTASNASALESDTWESPGTIGSTALNTGAFSTLGVGGVVGTPDLTVDGSGNLSTTGTLTSTSTSGITSGGNSAAGAILISDGGATAKYAKIVAGSGMASTPQTFTLPNAGGTLATTGGTVAFDNSTGQTATDGNDLFNLTSQNLGENPGAFITSTGDVVGNAATGLTIVATGVSGGVSPVGLKVSASGSNSNYAIIVPPSEGYVGIGVSTPAALLSVGTSSALQVDASGNLSTSGTVNGASYKIGGSTVLTANGSSTYAVSVGIGAGPTNVLGGAYLGYNAGNSITSATYNTCIGDVAGQYLQTGQGDVNVGAFAGQNSNGGSNTMVGFQAGQGTSGTSGLNTFIGGDAGIGNTSGTGNTTLGEHADLGSSGLTNATAIGYQAEAGASNSLILGSISGVNGAASSTKVGIGTTTPAALLSVGTSSALQVDASGNLSTSGTIASGNASDLGQVIFGDDNADAKTGTLELTAGGLGTNQTYYLPLTGGTLALTTNSTNFVDFNVSGAQSITSGANYLFDLTDAPTASVAKGALITATGDNTTPDNATGLTIATTVHSGATAIGLRVSSVGGATDAEDLDIYQNNGYWQITDAGAATFASVSATTFTGALTGTASNASELEGDTWASPGTIGSTALNTGAFSTLGVGGVVGSPDLTVDGTGDVSTTGTLGAAATMITIPSGSTNALTIANSGSGEDLASNDWFVLDTGAATFNGGLTLGTNGKDLGTLSLFGGLSDGSVATLEPAALGGAQVIYQLPAEATGTYTIATTGNVVVLNPAAAQTIQPSTSGVVALTIKAAGSGSADLQDWRNNGGGLQASIDNNGDGSFQSLTASNAPSTGVAVLNVTNHNATTTNIAAILNSATSGSGTNEGLVFNVTGGSTNNYDIVGSGGTPTWSVTSAGAGTFGNVQAKGTLVVSIEPQTLSGAGPYTATLTGNKIYYDVTNTETSSTASVTVTNATTGQIIYVFNDAGSTGTIDITLNSQAIHPNHTDEFIYNGTNWIEFIP